MLDDEKIIKYDILKKQQYEAIKRYNKKNKDKMNEKRRARYQLIKDDETFKIKNRENAKKHYYKIIENNNDILENNEQVKAIIKECIRSN
jgi:hypothetical protein